MRPKSIYLHNVDVEYASHHIRNHVLASTKPFENYTEYTDLSQVWHFPKETPTGEDTPCVVLVGIFEDGTDHYEVLEWSDSHGGFQIDNERWLSLGYDKWAYLSDLLPNKR